ncbi:hypothetical protein [Bacteroides sp. 519]|uniref:hypothetical protein n=1 Tax=Bacteroides sp. 519 TaxID=2302937 RepID=UPI0013CFF6BC|nr:hypothetical protein [Bacteroides sp. 519]NDV57369.1 hypothetical protein [Bacteroides sp. 519]
MAKQIKVIQCPQCGSTSPKEIDKDRYQCDRCDTKFFLDNDDINVNVNYRPTTPDTTTTPYPVKRKWVLIPIVAFALLYVLIRVVFVENNAAITVVNKELFSVPLAVNGQGFILSLELKNALSGKDGQGFYSVYRDADTDKVLKETKLQVTPPITNIDYRWFRSDSTHYVIVNSNHIYTIHTDSCMLVDVTPGIAAGKPALNAGFSSVAFVKEQNGEGFRLNTNLGKEFFYFPAADMLYTEKAFRYVATGESKTLLPHARQENYYLFLNTENNESSNVAQLMRVTYLFNNGGPENKLLKLTARDTKQLDKYRITSLEPITAERICFSPSVLHNNKNFILISYKATLAQDAPLMIELLNSKGEQIYLEQLGAETTIKHAICINNGFIIQTNNGYKQIKL